jgi:hypothetical protein
MKLFALAVALVRGPRLQVAGFVGSTGSHGDPTNSLRYDLRGEFAASATVTAVRSA